MTTADKKAKTITAWIDEIREEYSKVDAVDPAFPTYGKVCRFLDSQDTDMLHTLMCAKIKWISPMAANRYYARYKGQ